MFTTTGTEEPEKERERERERRNEERQAEKNERNLSESLHGAPATVFASISAEI